MFRNPGNCTVLSSSATSFSGVRPARHGVIGDERLDILLPIGREILKIGKKVFLAIV